MLERECEMSCKRIKNGCEKPNKVVSVIIGCGEIMVIE